MVITLTYVCSVVSIVAMVAVCLLCALSVVAIAGARLFQQGALVPKTVFILVVRNPATNPSRPRILIPTPTAHHKLNGRKRTFLALRPMMVSLFALAFIMRLQSSIPRWLTRLTDKPMTCCSSSILWPWMSWTKSARPMKTSTKTFQKSVAKLQPLTMRSTKKWKRLSPVQTRVMRRPKNNLKSSKQKSISSTLTLIMTSLITSVKKFVFWIWRWEMNTTKRQRA